MTGQTPARTIDLVTRDPSRTVEFRTGASGLNGLPWVAWAAVLGLGAVLFAAEHEEVMRGMGWFLMALLPVGLAVQWFAARNAQSEAPGLTLTPEGFTLAPHGWGHLTVTWAAVRAVSSRTIRVFQPRWRPGPPFMTLPRCTLVRIDAEVLAAARTAGSFRPGGPTGDRVIRDDEEGVEIVLNHDDFGLTPEEIRHAVEVRWQAFGGAEVAAGPDTALPPLRLGGFRPANRGLWWAGLGGAGLAAAVLLTNAAGLWQTEGQARDAATRAERNRMIEQSNERLRAVDRDHQDALRRMEERQRDLDQRMRTMMPNWGRARQTDTGTAADQSR